MAGPWVCFHCDQVCTTKAEARAHFGDRDGAVPACQIAASEGGLLRALRDAEADAERAWSAVHAESAEGLQAWRRAEGRQGEALIAMEQTGYERGLRDQARTIEVLRRALAWHGDWGRMATTREDWQQEVDEALRWVQSNPEPGRPIRPTFGTS